MVGGVIPRPNYVADPNPTWLKPEVTCGLASYQHPPPDAVTTKSPPYMRHLRTTLRTANKEILVIKPVTNMGVTNKRTITKTRRKTRDVDQIKADLLSPKHLSQWQDTKAAEDLPGLGRHYCTECAKWFETESTLVAHRKGKPHKRRVKQLAEEPYTQKEAEAAVGLVTDNGRQSRKVGAEDDIDMAT